MNDVNFAGNSKSCIDILGNEWKYDCMGCSINNGDIIPPGGIIYNGKNIMLGADPEIPIPGFLIVNTRRHVRSYIELTKEERYEISDIIVCAEKALKELNITNEITLVQEERSKHLHIWIFPHYEWMNKKYGKGIEYLRDISEYAIENNNEDNVKKVLEVVDKVRDYFNNNFIK